jgi:hypothetical protein
MAKAPKATTFSSRSNAKRAAEKAIATGTAPSIDYGIKEQQGGRFEIVWKDRAEEARARLGMPPTTEQVETEIATATAEADTRAEAEPEIEEAIASTTMSGCNHSTHYADECPDMPSPKEDADELQERFDSWESETASDGEQTMADRFPPGTRVIVQVSKRKRRTGAVDYRVDATSCRVQLDGPMPSELFRYSQLTLDDGSEPLALVEKPSRKPRAAPSGNRKPSKSAELDAAAARGETPTKPVMTSKANPHYQARFDKLEAMAMASDWAGVRGYEVKGINSYAKMVKQYRDRLLAAHAAQDAVKTEAA